MPAIALFDMDGALFDYEGQMKLDLFKIMNPGADAPNPMYTENLWDLAKQYPYLEARMELIKSVPGWWFNLPKLQLGWDILKVAQITGFCCHILTKGPRSKSRAWAEKVDCITHHLGEDFPIDIVGKDKDNRYGRVLVDDYPKYMLGWLEHRTRGLGIMPKQSVNEGFEHPNVIIYDGSEESMTKIRQHLRAAYNREPKQHWKDLLIA
jgi:hypothetical protein